MFPFRLFARRLPNAEQQLIISSFRDLFSSFQGIKSLILFGSAARGDMTDASDLDLIAVFAERLKSNLPKLNFMERAGPSIGRAMYFGTRKKNLKNVHLWAESAR